MKINTQYNAVENSDNFSKNLFSIGDPAIIFDILRSKLYSDPLGAVCREIISNARDSHIEANKSNVPIEIILPNKISPTLVIKDFGVGISPDRAENIFVQYGKSTKRSDNTQTGGFGMGCKCPFSITDSFSIVTVFDGIQYSYSAAIDETKVGALYLLDKRSTDAKNGTSIIIPIKEKDFNIVDEKINEITRFWDPKPIIKNSKIFAQTNDIEISSKNWFVLKNEPLNENKYSFNILKVLIHKIPYTISFSTLRGFLPQEYINFLYQCKFTPYLEFDVGELSLSASRETLYFDDITKNKLIKSIDAFISEFSVELSKTLNSQEDLFYASCYFANKVKHKYFHNLPKLDLKWNNYKIYSIFPLKDQDLILFTKNASGQIRKSNKTIFREGLFFENKKSAIYLNDLYFEGFKASSLKEAFKDNDSIIIINLSSKDMEDNYNLNYNLDKFNFSKISSINPIEVKAAKSKRNIKESKNPKYIYKYVSGDFYISSKEEFKKSNKNVIFYLSDYGRNYYNSRAKKHAYVDAHMSKSLPYNFFTMFNEKFPNHTIWGVLKEELTDREFLRKVNKDYDFIDSFLNNNSEVISFEEYQDLSLLNTSHANYKEIFSGQLSIIDKNSLFYEFKNDLKKKIDKLNKSNGELMYFDKSADYKKYNEWVKSEESISKLLLKINKAYPMLGILSKDAVKSNKTIIENYINTIDGLK